MSIKNTNIADYFTQIETLTNTNLQILKALNDSFFTNKNHIYANVDDTSYVIPSFLSLENKINLLQENFENLVKSPETGEAYFNFDGNSRSIEVRKYNYTPDSVTLNTVTNYNIDSNDIFKDFLTPMPYINLDLPTLPNDIIEVNVKKIVPKSEKFKEILKTKLGSSSSVQYKYSDMYSLLSTYVKDTVKDSNGVKNIYFSEDIDYVEYDTIYKLPLHKNIGTGTYIIESVVSDAIDERTLNENITLKIRGNLTYKLFDETIEKPLQIGDELINYDGSGKVVITNISTSNRELTVQVVNGEYLNFLGTDSYDTNDDIDIHDLSKLRFYKAADYSADKYIKVPLEEDQYVFIAVAPVNSRMNIQSSWGTGLLVNTYNLTNNSKDFNTYYKESVKNIGDTLFEMTSILTSPITKLSKEDFIKYTTLKPVLTNNMLKVMHINKHLNNSESIKAIRKAYEEKRIAENELDSVINKLNTITNYNDNSIEKNNLQSRKAELTNTINAAIESIAMHANSSEVPIENAKYRIRGFYIPTKDIEKHVVGINVQYRYRNPSSILGNATTMQIETSEDIVNCIYSDWNILNTSNRAKHATIENGEYKYDYEQSNENTNLPSYNQIDIPISQGESVDIRLQAIYDYGQPYLNVTSDWSETINVEFPNEFTKDIPILTIIEENNNDIENNKFGVILNQTGVTEHVKNKQIDGQKTYYHSADNISSGFMDNDSKIISLRDKLNSILNDISIIKNDIQMSNENLSVSIIHNSTERKLISGADNSIVLESYSNIIAGNSLDSDSTNTDNTDNTIIKTESIDGDYIISSNNVVSTVLNILLKNNSSSPVRLYSLFPGNRNIKINNTTSSYFKKSDYCGDSNEGVWFKYQQGSLQNKLQTQNQFITFRTTDPWTGEKYYKPNADAKSEKVHDSKKIDVVTGNDNVAMVVYPYVSTKYGLCIDSDESKTYKTLNPGDQVVIPINCDYIVAKKNATIKRTISFDLRTSLYKDPINYTFDVICKNVSTAHDKLSIINNKRLLETLTSNINTQNIEFK